MTSYLTNSNLISRRKRQKNNSKPREVNLIQGVIGVISIILSCHYYLSYRWLNGYLSYYQIDNLAIITFEDISYSFGSVNDDVIILSTLGFLWIYGWKLARSQADFDNAGKNLIKELKDAKTIWLQSSIKFKISFLAMILGTCWLYIFWFKPKVKFPNESFELLYLLILIAFPIAYILNSKKRNLIMGFHILCMFIWANLFVNKSIKSLSVPEAETKNKSFLKFNYDGESIETNDSLSLLYHGYKYLVLDAKSKGYKLYRTDKIDFVEYYPRKRSVKK